jgi:hypothetical protein
MVLASLLLGACVQNPLAEISLPQLCPRTSAGGEVVEMASLIRGHRRRDVIAHFGAPSRHIVAKPLSRDADVQAVPNSPDQMTPREKSVLEELGKGLAGRVTAPPNPDEETAGEKLIWGPLVIEYHRNDGRTVPMNCEVEMHADASGTITRVVWMLAPANAIQREREL